MIIKKKKCLYLFKAMIPFFKLFRINCNVAGYLGKHFIYASVNVPEPAGLIDLLIMALTDF